MRFSFHGDAMLRSLILAGFIFLLITLDSADELLFYIHPRFLLPAQLSAAVLAFFLLIQAWQALFSRGHHAHCGCGHDHSCRWLYIPFLFFLCIAFAFPTTSLSASLVANKGLNSRLGLPSSLRAETGDTAAIRQTHIQLTDANYVDVISKLIDNPTAYAGKEITMTGFVYREPSFTPSQVALVRYAVVCCSADASPFGLLCEFDSAGQYPADTWLTLHGTITEIQYHTVRIPIIKTLSVTPANKPKSPYVYPQ